MDKKIVTISSKRQITIPKKYFQMLGFDKEAECILSENELIIRPLSRCDGNEFAEQILANLIAQGLSGEQLLESFKEKKAQIRPAVEAMIAEAGKVARGSGDYVSYDEIKKMIDAGADDLIRENMDALLELAK